MIKWDIFSDGTLKAESGGAICFTEISEHYYEINVYRPDKLMPPYIVHIPLSWFDDHSTPHIVYAHKVLSEYLRGYIYAKQ